MIQTIPPLNQEPTRMCRLFAIACLLAFPAAPLAQVKAKNEPPSRPEPTAANFAYGDQSERQVFDFWQAKVEKPTPVVLLINGGGWMGGDKSSYATNAIQPFLDEGISVAALNYR